MEHTSIETGICVSIIDAEIGGEYESYRCPKCGDVFLLRTGNVTVVARDHWWRRLWRWLCSTGRSPK